MPKQLTGEYRCVLDEKGRLNFPAKMRDVMGDSFMVTRWLDDCLVAFPAHEWERVSEKLAEKSMVKRPERVATTRTEDGHK